MGYSDYKKLQRQERKPELTVFYTPHPTHIIRMAYQTMDGKRVMKVPEFRFSKDANQLRQEAVSIAASRKIKYAVNWMVEAAKTKRVFVKDTKKNVFFKVGFCTLTFPAGDCFATLDQLIKQVPVLYTQKGIQFIRSKEEREAIAQKKLDSICKSCLENFLSRARIKWNMKLYVWKAETTEQGIIHFHITWDCFAHYSSIRKTWNKILHHHGLTRQFFEVHGNNNPPSSQIKAVHKVKNIAAYICTYMAKKEEGRRVIQSRIWGCCEELQYSKRLKIDCPSQLSNAYDKSLSSTLFEWKSIDTIATNISASIHLADLFIFKNATIWNLPHGDLKIDIMEHVGKLRQSTQDLFYQVDTFSAVLGSVKEIKETKQFNGKSKIIQLSIPEAN